MQFSGNNEGEYEAHLNYKADRLSQRNRAVGLDLFGRNSFLCADGRAQGAQQLRQDPCTTQRAQRKKSAVPSKSDQRFFYLGVSCANPRLSATGSSKRRR